MLAALDILLEAITVEELEAHLRLPSDDEATYLHLLVRASTNAIEMASERAIAKVRYELRLDSFPRSNTIDLLTPLREVEEILYVDADGVEVEFTEFNYHGGGIVGDWPKGSDVRITFVAGYDEAPFPLRAAILLFAASLYENREADAEMQLHANPTFDRLIGPYRVY
jgi:uncharacterized phiE125 gp8 family phage protein